MKLTGLLLFLSGLSVTLQVTPEPRRRFRHFDDYLSSLDAKQQEMITGELQASEEVEGSGDDDAALKKESSVSKLPRLLPLRTGFARSKEATCCMLGQMAGDKGYHCYVKFYAARFIMRNHNRAHNRKMAFYGRDKVPNFGDKLMRTFERCVAGRGIVFHKCCHLAAMDKKSSFHYDTLHRMMYSRSHKV